MPYVWSRISDWSCRSLVVCIKTALYEQFSPDNGPHWFAWISTSWRHDGSYLSAAAYSGSRRLTGTQINPSGILGGLPSEIESSLSILYVHQKSLLRMSSSRVSSDSTGAFCSLWKPRSTHDRVASPIRNQIDPLLGFNNEYHTSSRIACKPTESERLFSDPRDKTHHSFAPRTLHPDAS